MSTRTSGKQRRSHDQRSVATLAAIAVLIVAIVAALYFYLDWQNNRPGTPAEELEVTASVGETDVSAPPFSVCEFGADCPEGEVATISVRDADTVRITVPEELSEQQWSLLSIYDDPAANSERAFTPHETAEVDIPVHAEKEGAQDGVEAPKLIVIEVHSLMIGQDDAGEETPVMATWSFATDAA